MSVFERLLSIREEKGAGFFLLLDPDRIDRGQLIKTAETAEACGVDAVLAGSSFITGHDFDARMTDIKGATDLPVIIFPGNAGQVSRHADGILFMSLISGRNPTYLIEEQVKAAPAVKTFGLETIPTGYMLIESGTVTSVQYISGTMPIPRGKNDIAMAHALAAQYLGMKMIYLEAGSGSDRGVPEEMVAAVSGYVELPVVVGGGIRKPQQAADRVSAGASFIVVGTAVEESCDEGFLTEMSDAVHTAARTTV
ncbi:MAG: geranylgeranylglyceryl/heptaprenylglyceryl phosphate synthase [FCB group bacterium]|nr:geranylgeranylglyceryl/heptaprenylglyceryl phosphate synthase [FCB group bacterium]